MPPKLDDWMAELCYIRGSFLDRLRVPLFQQVESELRSHAIHCRVLLPKSHSF